MITRRMIKASDKFFCPTRKSIRSQPPASCMTPVDWPTVAGSLFRAHLKRPRLKLCNRHGLVASRARRMWAPAVACCSLEKMFACMFLFPRPSSADVVLVVIVSSFRLQRAANQPPAQKLRAVGKFCFSLPSAVSVSLFYKHVCTRRP